MSPRCGCEYMFLAEWNLRVLHHHHQIAPLGERLTAGNSGLSGVALPHA